MEGICAVYQLGNIEYQPAWELQGRLAAEIAAGERPPTLLLLEHPHTFTFGRRGKVENLLWSEDELRQRGVGIHWVDRGGDVTYHGPGQLVGYPLLPLGTQGLLVSGDSGHLPQADYVGYVRRLEDTLIQALEALGLAARREAGKTGVWLPADALLVQREDSHASRPAKIAAIGVKVDARGVTRHGFALNVDPDMSYWEGIIGCGLVGYPVTSLAQCMQSVPGMEAVIEAVITAFGQVYSYRMIPGSL